MSDLSNIYAYLDAHWDEHLERVRNFVRVPSISATGEGMPETAQNVAALIRQAGGSAEIVPTQG